MPISHREIADMEEMEKGRLCLTNTSQTCKKRNQGYQNSITKCDCGVCTSALLHHNTCFSALSSNSSDETRWIFSRRYTVPGSDIGKWYSSPFLKLAPELRLAVYRHFLVKEIQTEHDCPSCHCTAVLLTHRAICLEAYPTFLFDNMFELQICCVDLKSLGPQSRNELHTLTILITESHYGLDWMHTVDNSICYRCVPI